MKLWNRKTTDRLKICVKIQGVPKHMTPCINGLNVFFHNLLSCLIRKRIIKNIVWESSYSKIDLKVKYIRVKDFLN